MLKPICLWILFASHLACFSTMVLAQQPAWRAIASSMDGQKLAAIANECKMQSRVIFFVDSKIFMYVFSLL